MKKKTLEIIEEKICRNIKAVYLQIITISVAYCHRILNLISNGRDVPIGAPLDLSTPTGMSCIGTYGENCESDNVSKYRVLLVAFLLLWHEKMMSRKIQ